LHRNCIVFTSVDSNLRGSHRCCVTFAEVAYFSKVYYCLQESDRLRDEDLFKFLQDPKRPCSVMKKLKCVPGVLKLDISPCPDEPKNCLTPELVRLQPYPGKCAIVIGVFNDGDE
jgi:hypothetical protein